MFLLDGAAQLWVAHVLARALNARHRPTLIVYLDRQMSQQQAQLANPEQAISITVPLSRKDDRPGSASIKERILDKLSADQPVVEYGLLPLTTTQTDVLAAFDCLLLPVPATAGGIRRAYISIKQIKKMGKYNIGVVMLGATDLSAAKSYFDKLAIGAFRFLGIRLFYGGCLNMPNYVVDNATDLVQGITELCEIADFVLSHQLYSPVTARVDRL